MAGQKSIEIKIFPDGKTTYDLDGFTDGSCLKETEGLEKAVGGKVTKRTNKAEAYKAGVGAGRVTVGKKR